MAFKHIHLLSVALLGVLFLLRTVLLLLQSPARQARLLRILPHVLATLALVSGLAMVHQFGMVPAWVMVKLALLFAFILAGTMAFQRADKRSTQLVWVAAGLLIYAFIVSVALTRLPLGLFA